MCVEYYGLTQSIESFIRTKSVAVLTLLILSPFGDGKGEVAAFRFTAESRANLSRTEPSTSNRVDMTNRLQHTIKLSETSQQRAN